MMRTTTLLAMAALAVSVGGCGGPYKGKPDKLPKGPKKVPVPEGTETPTEEKIVWIEDCSAKFTEDPNKAKKSSSKAAPFNNQGNDLLAAASTAKDPTLQVNNIIGAIEQFKKALVEDHYNAEAT